MKAITSVVRNTNSKCLDCTKIICGGEPRFIARLDGWGRELHFCLACGGKR